MPRPSAIEGQAQSPAGLRRRARQAGGTRRRVVVRLTAEEHLALQTAAAAPGLHLSLARYVAEAALAVAGEQATRVPRRAPTRLALAEVAAAAAAVNRVGNNLNQLAREKNTTGMRPIGSLEAERRALSALQLLAETAARVVGEVE